MNYSPFTDENGNFLRLKEIEYSHLDNLKNVDEGFQVEYKSRWDDSVKKKIAQSISSFANTNGGWFFVGVNDDGSLNPIPKERTDFGQQIGEILKTRVSLSPKFETKFITLPDDKERGVLVVHVYEGEVPPYICDGTIYTRVGSSSNPSKVSSKSDIDHLYSKQKHFKELLDEFCTDKVFDDYKGPMCTLYLYNSDDTDVYVGDLHIKDNLMEDLLKRLEFQSYMPSSFMSYLFANSETIKKDNYTSMVEFVKNWSFKIYFPLLLVPDTLAEDVNDSVGECKPNIDIEHFKALDGFLSTEMMCETIVKCIEFLKSNGKDLENYKIRAELNNVKYSYLFFPTFEHYWLNFICDNNFRYSIKDKLVIDVPLIDFNDNIIFIGAYIAYFIMSFSFGYSIDEFNALRLQSIVVKEKMLGHSRFSSVEYYDKLAEDFENYI